MDLEKISSTLSRFLALMVLFIVFGAIFIVLAVLDVRFNYQMVFIALGITFFVFSLPLIPGIMRIREAINKEIEKK